MVYCQDMGPADTPEEPRIPLGVVSRDEIPGLYRATKPQHPDWDDQGVIRPRRWVESSSAWPGAVEGIDNPKLLVKLALEPNNLPPPVSLEKLIAEALFERVRLEVAPGAPSRLNCVFVALDAYGAMDFASEQSGEPIIDPGTGDIVNWPVLIPVSTGGRPWIALDMRLFSMHQRTATDERGMIDQLTQLDHLARDYWKGRTGLEPFIEVLIEAVDVPSRKPASSAPGH